MLTAISAVLYALSFAVAFILRVILLVATWIMVTLALGWQDAWGKSPKEPMENPGVIRATDTSYAPAPQVLRRERVREAKAVNR